MVNIMHARATPSSATARRASSRCTGAAARGERREAAIVARAAHQVNRVTPRPPRPLRSLPVAVCWLGWLGWLCALACAAAAASGCHTPAAAVPRQDPILTGLEVGLEVTAEVLREEGYALKPNLATRKTRIETGWRAEPSRRRSVTVTLRDTPHGLIVSTRLLTAIPAPADLPIDPATRIDFDGHPWHLIRPLSDDDAAEQLRIAQRIQSRWRERMRGLE
jgi:hypothetical protein